MVARLKGQEHASSVQYEQCSTSRLWCRLNKCGVISPRYDVKHGDIEAWVARLLPSRLVSSCSSMRLRPLIW